MNLKILSDSELHLGTKKSVLEEKASTIKVLKFIEEIHRRKLFIDLGHSTLMKYMVHDLGYTEAESWTRIQAMKLMTEVPGIEDKIGQGTMSLSNAALLKDALRKNEKVEPAGFSFIEPVAKPSKEEIISKALDNSELPVRKFKGLLNLETKEKKIILNQRVLKKMEKILGSMSEVELIESLLDEKLKTLELSKSTRTSQKQSSNSRYIPMHVQRTIFTRANHQCEHNNGSGHRCKERRNLQMDHIKPYALGGENSVENMRILCSGHNHARSFKTFNKMNKA